jgi:hypothetical protein
MKVGLIGYPGSGKTTVFNMLTGLRAELGGFGGRAEIHLGVIKVPDPRVDKLAELFKPKKTTYAEVRFTDFPPTQGEDGFAANEALIERMREVDAIALVLGDFEPGANPLKEMNRLLEEMILADMTVVENRLGRLKKEKARPLEQALLERCARALENVEGLRRLALSAEEESLLSGFGFLSRKPVLVLFNQGDDHAGRSLAPSQQAELERHGLLGLALAAKMELEIARLNQEDRAAFLKEMGIVEPARDRFIRACYGLLHLISFFTTGADEVRAWTVTQGTPARKAAGKVHSDMERGFIRAEVVPYKEFIALGSEARCREMGKLRLEGKDYRVQDGDIIHFRFAI